MKLLTPPAARSPVRGRLRRAPAGHRDRTWPCTGRASASCPTASTWRASCAFADRRSRSSTGSAWPPPSPCSCCRRGWCGASASSWPSRRRRSFEVEVTTLAWWSPVAPIPMIRTASPTCRSSGRWSSRPARATSCWWTRSAHSADERLVADLYAVGRRPHPAVGLGGFRLADARGRGRSTADRVHGSASAARGGRTGGDVSSRLMACLRPSPRPIEPPSTSSPRRPSGGPRPPRIGLAPIVAEQVLPAILD